jgi:uncharacterized protein DUF4384
MRKQAHERRHWARCGARTTLVERLFAIGICAACGGHPSLETHDGEAKPLDLTVRVRAERDSRRWGIASGDTLKTGDYFELFVSPNQPAYIYVIEILPDGSSAPLFPEKGDRLLMPGREHRIPEAADESFQIDSHDMEENIYLLMSRGPLVQASALISTPDRRASTASDSRRDLRPSGSPRRDQGATDPGSANPRRPDRVLSITTRRVIRVKRPDGTPAVVDTTEQPKDSTLVIHFYFRHTQCH